MVELFYDYIIFKTILHTITIIYHCDLNNCLPFIYVFILTIYIKRVFLSQSISGKGALFITKMIIIVRE